MARARKRLGRATDPDRDQSRHPGITASATAANVPDREHSIGGFVRTRRRANRLTQARLGELAGVGRRLVIELEAGKKTLRLGAVNAVLAVFGKTLGVIDSPRPELDE